MFVNGYENEIAADILNYSYIYSRLCNNATEEKHCIHYINYSHIYLKNILNLDVEFILERKSALRGKHITAVEKVAWRRRIKES